MERIQALRRSAKTTTLLLPNDFCASPSMPYSLTLLLTSKCKHASARTRIWVLRSRFVSQTHIKAVRSDDDRGHHVGSPRPPFSCSLHLARTRSSWAGVVCRTQIGERTSWQDESGPSQQPLALHLHPHLPPMSVTWLAVSGRLAVAIIMIKNRSIRARVTLQFIYAVNAKQGPPSRTCGTTRIPRNFHLGTSWKPRATKSRYFTR